MKTLTITELSRTKRLDRPAMAAERGSWKKIHQLGDISFFVNFDPSIDAAQNLEQLREVVSAKANGSAFVEGVHVGQNQIAGG